ncbi:MAG: ATPase, T2SS/T4P/T4SS family [Actinomycetaceae bacterium]|nr:ATPase, T2SS/T4P/T4SS family [Actinomycetaceae bacterium]
MRARHLVAQGKTPAQALAQTLPDGASADFATIRYQQLAAELGGLPLEIDRLLQDPKVSDVLVNKPGEIWVDRGKGLERRPAQLPDLREMAMKIASACGRRLDDANPIMDGKLPGGARVNIVLPPLVAYPTVSLRAFSEDAFSYADLCGGMVSLRIAPLLRRLFLGGVSGLISGATGTGKTTLLGALLGEIPPNQRIICVEEVSELRPRHPHVVSLSERKPNLEGAGAVTLAELVRAALRMRPDRLVVGECRGREVRDMLAAMNTGHAGAWATIHANSAQDVPARLAALGASAHMSQQETFLQAGSAIQLLLHLRRERGRRWVEEIALLSADFQVLPAARISADGRVRCMAAWSEFMALAREQVGNFEVPDADVGDLVDNSLGDLAGNCAAEWSGITAGFPEGEAPVAPPAPW